ncbi:MAG: phospholipase [Bacteroidota bacterium]
MQHHQLKVQRTAHYYTLGEPSEKTKYFIIACHGYAQLAKHFLRRFDGLLNEETFIVAPEGLSRFYWKGVTGDVAASWMTKENRLSEIEDYSNYLQQVYEHYRAQLPEEVRIQLFGFSQGCATQCRWLMAKEPHFHDLILWAGLFPEDIDYRPQQVYLKDKKLYFVYGAQDEYLQPKFLKMHEDLLTSNELQVHTEIFEGNHEVDRAVLADVYERLLQ